MGKKSVAGLNFGDRNNIDLDKRVDITGTNNDIDDKINQEHLYDLQLYQQQEYDDDVSPLQDPTPLDTHLEAVNNTTDTNSNKNTQRTEVDVVNDAQLVGVAPENVKDEIEPSQVNEIEPTQVDSNSNKEEQGYMTRCNRISHTHEK